MEAFFQNNVVIKSYHTPLTQYTLNKRQMFAPAKATSPTYNKHASNSFLTVREPECETLKATVTAIEVIIVKGRKRGRELPPMIASQL